MNATSIAERRDRRADLVLEGGGVKGIGLVGAILVLTDAGFTFPRVAGTSAGAIVASLLAALEAAGQPPSRLRGYLEHIDYAQFERKDALQRINTRLGDAVHLVRHMGLRDGHYLIEWLGAALEEIGVTTFAQLRIGDSDDPGDGPARALPLPPGGAHRRHHPRQAGPASVGLPRVRRRRGRPADRRRRAGLDVDPDLLRSGSLRRQGCVRRRCELSGRVRDLGRRWPVVGLPGGGLRSSRRTTRTVADHRREALRSTDRDAARPAGPQHRRRASGLPAGSVGERRPVLHRRGQGGAAIFVDGGSVKATDFGLTPAMQGMLFENGKRAAEEFLAAAAAGRGSSSPS